MDMRRENMEKSTVMSSEETDEAAQRARTYFREGYNCCQSVFLAFADRYGFDRELACRLSASFGGGIGRLREVCGTVSAMALICGLECGATEGSDREGKAANYEQMQQLAAQFKEQSGSLICRELLGLGAQTMDRQVDWQNGQENDRQNRETIIGGMGNFHPQERTEQYYEVRPCERLVGLAAEIIQKWLDERTAKNGQDMAEQKDKKQAYEAEMPENGEELL